VPTRKAQGLLAYLALPRGRAHPRDQLAALLWGDMRDEQARTNLRQTLFTLRQALPVTDPDSLRLDGSHLTLDPAAVDVDVAVFEQLVKHGTPAATAIVTRPLDPASHCSWESSKTLLWSTNACGSVPGCHCWTMRRTRELLRC